jgi:hypothetical protein
MCQHSVLALINRLSEWSLLVNLEFELSVFDQRIEYDARVACVDIRIAQ